MLESDESLSFISIGLMVGDARYCELSPFTRDTNCVLASNMVTASTFPNVLSYIDVVYPTYQSPKCAVESITCSMMNVPVLNHRWGGSNVYVILQENRSCSHGCNSLQKLSSRSLSIHALMGTMTSMK